MGPVLPEGIVKAAAFTSYEYVMIVLGILVAFFFIVIVSRIIPNRVQLFLAGVSIKIAKKYVCRDILKINGGEWYIDHLNTYRIVFSKVIEWNKTERWIKLDQDVDLSIDYITFLKMKIHRLGNCRS